MMLQFVTLQVCIAMTLELAATTSDVALLCNDGGRHHFCFFLLNNFKNLQLPLPVSLHVREREKESEKEKKKKGNLKPALGSQLHWLAKMY
jgi:hypothetical protein